MLAEIQTSHATEAGVNVLRKSVYRNMDFDSAEQGPEHFSAPAEVSAQGLDSFIADLKLKHAEERRILLKVYTKEWKTSEKAVETIAAKRAERNKLSLDKKRLAALPAEKPNERERYLPELEKYIKAAPKVVSFMEYIVKAYVYTGRAKDLGGRQYEEVAPIGSYGYVVRHYENVDSWSFGIEGARKIDEHTYLLVIPKESKAKISDTVRAYDPPRWSFGLLGGMGVGIPSNGSFSAAGGGGKGLALFYLGKDLKDQEVSLQALGGYDYFPGKDGGDAWKTASLSLGARFCLPFIGKWSRWYCAIGGGLFQDDGEKLAAGALVGLGLDFAVSRPVHLHIGGDFLGNKEKALLGGSAGLVFRLYK
jgi:hypothetical protein